MVLPTSYGCRRTGHNKCQTRVSYACGHSIDQNPGLIVQLMSTGRRSRYQWGSNVVALHCIRTQQPKTLTAKQNCLNMPDPIICLIRNSRSQAPRVGVLTHPLGTLDQFSTHDIGFSLSFVSFQELEKQRLPRDVLRHTHIQRSNCNKPCLQGTLRKNKTSLPL